MDQPRSGVDGPGPGGGAEAFLPVQAFLSLWLVLLAFFIVLASVSQPEAGRAVKAIASVRASFPSDLPLGSPTGEATNLFVEAERTLPERVGRLVAADLPVAAPRRDPSTGQISTEMPLDTLFSGAGFSRPGEALLRRMAAFLAAPPEGMRVVVTALVAGTDGAATDRAARIARALIEYGAPGAVVTAGTERTASQAARFAFGLRSAAVSP